MYIYDLGQPFDYYCNYIDDLTTSRCSLDERSGFSRVMMLRIRHIRLIVGAFVALVIDPLNILHIRVGREMQ